MKPHLENGCLVFEDLHGIVTKVRIVMIDYITETHDSKEQGIITTVKAKGYELTTKASKAELDSLTEQYKNEKAGASK
ncbi:MAG: hypothetical protein ABS904_00925 [Solibacillus isronensis]